MLLLAVGSWGVIASSCVDDDATLNQLLIASGQQPVGCAGMSLGGQCSSTVPVVQQWMQAYCNQTCAFCVPCHDLEANLTLFLASIGQPALTCAQVAALSQCTTPALAQFCNATCGLCSNASNSMSNSLPIGTCPAPLVRTSVEEEWRVPGCGTPCFYIVDEFGLPVPKALIDAFYLLLLIFVSFMLTTLAIERFFHANPKRLQYPGVFMWYLLGTMLIIAFGECLQYRCACVSFSCTHA